jgi:transposase InsO family protein
VIESLTGQGINVRHACHVLGVSESGYYAWRDRPPSPRTLRRIWLASEIVDVHKASNGTYGARRVMAELRHGRQIAVGHNAVELIMRELGVVPGDVPNAVDGWAVVEGAVGALLVVVADPVWQGGPAGVA